MHRALAILKYVPAVLCGLYAVIFVGTGLCLSEIQVHWYCNGVTFDVNATEVQWTPSARPSLLFVNATIWNYESLSGNTSDRTWEAPWRVRIPVVIVFTVLLGISAGAFTRFRFPLWSYFAWTALVAVELAYYLR